MGDSNDSKNDSSLPSWQQKPADQNAENQSAHGPDNSSRESTVEQAKKFLEDDEVRNASTERKIAFLEKKGIQGEDIHKLLGDSQSTAPTAASSETSQTPQIEPRSPPPSSPFQQQQHGYTPQPSTRASQPPIITYPEFLTQPTAPSPLITKPRLLTTLYVFSGISLLLYGTHTYLTTPMLASLTSSRHALAETATKNLERLIERLEGAVSEIPAGQKRSAEQADRAGRDGRYRDADAYADDSSDEDPTEMFHRDIGVQTSLPASPAPASPSLTAAAAAAALQPPSPRFSATESQATRLADLKASLESVVEDSTSEGYDQQDLEATINVLREYCDGLAYVTPTVYGYGGNVGGSASGSGKDDKDDEIAKVKAGIRGVKGVLLSARSFPGAVRAGGR